MEGEMDSDMNNIKTSLLTDQLKSFFEPLTTNHEVLELVDMIQNQLEKGDTAIHYDKVIEDDIISSDGEKGYIVINNGLAGFRRYYTQEQFIKKAFLDTELITINCDVVKSAIERIVHIIDFKDTNELDEQWQACLSSLFHKHFILNGGPGTGKTTTVIRMMMLYLAIDDDKTMALAAPTGKAANRMMQSIHQALSAIDISESWRVTLSKPAQTLHRLLGYNHQNNQLKYNKDNPLPYDYVIVDEASMLDVTMTCALLNALKPHAQLLLMGDSNQLPAVEAGNVFSDLCVLLNNKKQTDLFHYYLGKNPTDQISINNYVKLKKNYRFDQDSVIGQACDGLITQNEKAFKSLRHHGLNWFNPVTKTEQFELLKQWYQCIAENESTILLSPVNFGMNSVSELNELAIKFHHNNYAYNEGMPIMVTKNDYTLNVFNGDIGYLTQIDYTWYAAFMIEGQNKHIKLDAINQWVVAYAISIHKSQGSEYDHVLIVLPEDTESALLTNALLFTAISRAKKSITLWSSEEIIDKIIKTKHRRVTFLQ